MKLKKIIELLIIIGTASLIFWKSEFSKTFIPKPSEFFFILTILASYRYFVWNGKFKKLSYIGKKTYFCLFVFFFSIIFATFISYIAYDIEIGKKGILLILKLLMCLGLFIIIYVFLKEDRTFYKKMSIALSFPPLIFLPFLIYPEFAQKLSMVQDNRFLGFTLNPTTGATFNFISLSFIFILFMYNFHKKRWLNSILFFLLTIGMSGLVFWSQSRSYLIAMVGAFSIGSILMGIYFRKSNLKISLYVSLSILAAVLIFLILPATLKYSIIQRITQTFIDQTNNPRFLALDYYSDLILHNPLGFGFNFDSKFFIKWIDPRNANIENHGVNTILDVLVYGGIGAALSMLYLLWRVFINVKNRLRDNNDPSVVYILGATTALSGMWIKAIFAGSPIFDFSFWILLAMASVRSTRIGKNYEMRDAQVNVNSSIIQDK